VKDLRLDKDPLALLPALGITVERAGLLTARIEQQTLPFPMSLVSTTTTTTTTRAGGPGLVDAP
jgi:hypothetical protein